MERRDFVKGLGFMSFAPMAWQSSGLTKKSPLPVNNDNGPTLHFFKNPTNEFRFLNVLGKAHYRFADLGELLAIRQLSDETKPDSFVNAYLQFADQCRKIAENSQAKGHPVSAKDAFFRASNYYYAAMDYLDEAQQTDRFPLLFKQHRECWQSAMRLTGLRYEEFQIPYEGTALAGFLIRHQPGKTSRPLCIFNNGSDGSILDWWTTGGAGMFERGYDLMTFDGPGQGSSLFEKKLYFRYDWEKVITPVVDAALKQPGVDKQKLVLYGISQAGYWAPRALAFEPRFKAAIIDPGVCDVSLSWLKHLPAPMLGLLEAGDKANFNEYMETGFKQSPVAMAVYQFRARPYGFDNPYDTYKSVAKYKLDNLAGNISCPVIITSPEYESFWPGQSQQLFDLVKSPKKLIAFTAAEGADFHCEPKARLLWEQRVLDSLDEIVIP